MTTTTTAADRLSIAQTVDRLFRGCPVPASAVVELARHLDEIEPDAVTS